MKLIVDEIEYECKEIPSGAIWTTTPILGLVWQYQDGSFGVYPLDGHGPRDEEGYARNSSNWHLPGCDDCMVRHSPNILCPSVLATGIYEIYEPNPRPSDEWYPCGDREVLISDLNYDPETSTYPVIDIRPKRPRGTLELAGCRAKLIGGIAVANEALAMELRILDALDSMPDEAMLEEPRLEGEVQADEEIIPHQKHRFSAGEGSRSGATSPVVTASATWEDLGRLVSATSPAKHHRFISPGLQPPHDPEAGGSNRRDATGFGAEIICLDFDGPDGRGDSLRDIARALRALRAMGRSYIACTTFNSAAKTEPGRARWRLILPAEAPLPSDVYYRRAWSSVAQWADKLGLETDKALGHIAAVSFVGHRPGDARAWVRVHHAQPWPVDLEPPSVVSASEAAKQEAPRRVSPGSQAAKYLAAVPGVGAGDRHSAALKLGAKLIHNFDLSHEGLMGHLRAWGDTCDPPMSESELDKIAIWFATKGK